MKRNNRYKAGAAIAILIILSLACSSQVTVVETALPVNAKTLVAQTMTVFTQQASAATPTFVPTLTSVPASETAESFGTVYVYTFVENVNLRINPGVLFKVSRVMPLGTRLQLLGRAPDFEWLKVQNDEGIIGWVNVNVVKGGYDGPPPPVIEPTDVLVVTGVILTEAGTPVSGIGFDVTQGSRSTHAITNADGRFYAYLPTNMSGVWSVGYSSISCTSNTMDANCNCINNYCGSAFPESVLVQLPQQQALSFVWK